LKFEPGPHFTLPWFYFTFLINLFLTFFSFVFLIFPPHKKNASNSPYVSRLSNKAPCSGDINTLTIQFISLYYGPCMFRRYFCAFFDQISTLFFFIFFFFFSLFLFFFFLCFFNPFSLIMPSITHFILPKSSFSIVPFDFKARWYVFSSNLSFWDPNFLNLYNFSTFSPIWFPIFLPQSPHHFP